MKPTFIGIGPARCGTTSVYYYLRQHPRVFMSPVKETQFFAFQVLQAEFANAGAMLHGSVRSWEQYEGLFRDAGAARAIGEISPVYFWLDGVAEAIHQSLPDARIFCILRNPIDRAYSSYQMHADQGRETRSFGRIVQDELDSPSKYPLEATNYYIRIGFYAHHLTPYVGLFGSKQMKICFYDDLESSADEFMRALFAFLGVDPESAVDTSPRFNTLSTLRMEKTIRTRGLAGLIKRLRRILPVRLYVLLYRGYSASLAGTASAPTMPKEPRERLRDAYARDIEALQSLTGRDLSHWLAA